MSARPYIGRHVEPPLSKSPRPLSVAKRICILLDAARMARINAHVARRGGHFAKSAAAFYRAHRSLEMVRNLKDSR